MKKPPTVFKAGSRPSNLALRQSREALDRIEGLLPGVRFETVAVATDGDADRTIDLRESPADFFTQALDDALLRGEVDLAVHSAKDLPDPVPEGVDWFWLPWREEPRDVLVLAEGRTAADLPRRPVIGISSERRADYCRRRFPEAEQRMIRGNIEERIAQLDAGAYDAVIMAAAALIRLGLAARISEWIPLEALPVPDGQGFLAVTFRGGDLRMQALRDLFVQSVTFAGAGTGDRSLCTVATLQALQRCDVCLHDSLIDMRLLELLPTNACAIDVGKRCGAHSREQHETTRLICICARRSLRVVRLKSGDPGIFGRLAEETEALEALGIPYRVIPGISALQTATTGTGMLPTRRDVARGFTALTPRQSGGTLGPCGSEMKSRLPVIYYMSIKAVGPVAQELLAEGWPPDTPAALAFNAGRADEEIIRSTLGRLPEAAIDHCTPRPGLILVGEITAYGYNRDAGALRGRAVLVTCSESVQENAVNRINDFGGRPIPFPLIRLEENPDVELRFSEYGWLVVTSPSSVRALMNRIEQLHIDRRALPRIMVCGRGTADALAPFGLYPDAQPERDYSAEALVRLAQPLLSPGTRVLRVRSDKAGPALAEALRQTGAAVDDAVICRNRPVAHEVLPAFDTVFFASASAVESFIDQWGAEALKGKIICVIGRPTANALEQHGRAPDVIAREATVMGAIDSLAAFITGERLCSPKPD